jgi:hypothetical protein
MKRPYVHEITLIDLEALQAVRGGALTGGAGNPGAPAEGSGWSRWRYQVQLNQHEEARKMLVDQGRYKEAGQENRNLMNAPGYRGQGARDGRPDLHYVPGQLPR